MYYKVIKDGKIIDALDELQCVRYFKNIGILRCRKEDDPQGIISPDGEHIWHVTGWGDFQADSGWNGDTVTLEECNPDLYDEIRRTIDAGNDYSEFEPSSQTDEEILAGPTPSERLEALENALAIMALEGRII